jgi:release factor glutamine methyltransferase
MRSRPTSGRDSSAAPDVVNATWQELRLETARALADAGVERADTEARFMVEEASGSDAREWWSVAETLAPVRAEAHLRRMCERRRAGEPLQYALGSWSFRGIDVMVDRRVLIPRPETEWVVEVALEEAARVGLQRVSHRPPFDGEVRGYAADLGTGSGAIAIALEHALADVEVWATDASADALSVASANIAGHAATRVRLAEGSWFDALPQERRGRFSLVVTNPPYVAEREVESLPDEVRSHEPRHALVAGPTGLEALTEIIGAAPEWLARPATLVCEIAPTQADDVVALGAASSATEALVREDLARRPRVLVVRYG